MLHITPQIFINKTIKKCILMKSNQLIRIIVVSIVVFTTSQLYAQSFLRDSIYDKTMSMALAKLDSVNRNVETAQQCKNLFERIAQIYSQEWLPAYYAVYSNINSVFYDVESKNSEAFLSEAIAGIEKLYNYPNADLSEVNTLKAYYYTALTLTNPKKNGKKYFSEIIDLYEKAIEENPQNPRPIILLADYEQRLPAFIRSKKRKYDDEIAKAKVLFEREEANIEKPYWGKYFLKAK